MPIRRYSPYQQPNFMDSFLQSFLGVQQMQQRAQAIQLQQKQGDRQQFSSLMNAMVGASKIPKSMRGPFVDSLTQGLQNNPDLLRAIQPYADAVKKGNDEEVTAWIQNVADATKGSVGITDAVKAGQAAGQDPTATLNLYDKMVTGQQAAQKAQAQQAAAQIRSQIGQPTVSVPGDVSAGTDIAYGGTGTGAAANPGLTPQDPAVTAQLKGQIATLGYLFDPNKAFELDMKGTGPDTNTLGGIQASIIRNMATDPITNQLDTTKAMDVLKDMRTNPQGFESRLYDHYVKKFGPGDQAVAATKKDLAEIAGAKSFQVHLQGGYGDFNAPAKPGVEQNLARLNPKTGQVEFAPMGLTPKQYTDQGYRRVDEQTSTAVSAIAPAKVAWTDFQDNAKELMDLNKTLVGKASAVAGQRGGGIAQSLGASDVFQRLEASQSNYFQHYERMVGGIRGAAGAQIQTMMRTQSGVLATDQPKVIAAKMAYLNNVRNGMEQAIKLHISGKPVPPSLIEDRVFKPIPGVNSASYQDFLNSYGVDNGGQ